MGLPLADDGEYDDDDDDLVDYFLGKISLIFFCYLLICIQLVKYLLSPVHLSSFT